MSFIPPVKVSGVGDVPDLISDETPPAVILEIASDSDVQSASSRKDLLMEGESNDNGPGSQEQEGKILLQSWETPSNVSSKIKMFEMTKDLNNNICFIMGQPDTGEIDENVKKGKADFHALSDAMTTNITGLDKSGAVNAPDAEEQFACVDVDGNDDSHGVPKPAAQNDMKTFERTSPPKVEIGSSHIPTQVHYATSPHPICSTSSKNNNHNKGNGPSELLSKEKKQSSTSCTRSRSLSKSIGLPTVSPSKTGKSLFAAKRVGSQLGRESRSPSARRQSRSRSKSQEESSKSPVKNVVEVRERKESVVLKSVDGKPVSPYLCKVFPVKSNEPLQNPKQHGQSFPVTGTENRLLNQEIRHSLERERLLLWKAMHGYFRGRNIPFTAPRPGPAPHPNTNRAVGHELAARNVNPHQRETYMSWIINGNRSDSENEGWNPLANIFRKSRSTQVSQTASVDDSNQRASSSSPPPLLSSYSNATFDLAKKIHIVCEEQENAISTSARSMYQGLKIAQKALHLSDLFCFRNSVPESALGDSLNQPDFQQFMESGNEIEILINLMSILGTAKDDIQTYLNSIQEANLITEKESGLVKLGGNWASSISNGHISSISSLGNHNEEEKAESLDPLTCPCQSHISVRLNNDGLSSERMLPSVHTFLEEQRNVTLGSYIKKDKGRNRLIQVVMFNGHKYQIQFASATPETSCAIQGVMTATMDYVGEPTCTTLESLLGTIHRCTSYMDTRMACSCVWARQSKRYMLETIEKYLKKEHRPTSDMGWWGLRRMEERLRRFNVFAGIIESFCNELVEAIGKLHFCMQKSVELLNTKLRGPKLPGFTEVSLSSDEEDDCSSIGERDPYNKDPDINEKGVSSSVEVLYNKLKSWMERDSDIRMGDNISIETLLKIVVLAVKDINSTTALGTAYSSNLKMPTKKTRRVLRFMNATLSQLGLSKDVEFGALMATFLSATDKLNFFDEFMCEQKVDIRAKVNLLCQQIIQKLIDLRCLLTMQRGWSSNLAKNSFMRIKEINEIRRLRALKKKENHISERLQLLRGSDVDVSLVRILGE